jgi:hypothetical protein
MDPKCDAIFVKHLQIIKSAFHLGKTHKVDNQNMMVDELFNVNDFDCQQGMFKLTMKSNVTTCMTPPLTKMWHVMTTFQIFSFSFPKYVKLAKLAMVQIVGSVEDEKCVSTLAFMMSKLWSRLTTHLPLVVRMFAQCTLQNFPYASVLNNGKELAINIVMMAMQQAFYICWASFYKGRSMLLQILNGCFMSHITFFPWC